MEPSNKSTEMNVFLDTFTKDIFGRGRYQSIANNICVMCGKEVGEFRNAISEREYKISGMCQNCQDSVFGED